MCLGIQLNIKKYSTLIGSLICLIGCAFQIYDITNDYLSNEIITKRLINPIVDLPGFTICINKISTFTNQNKIKDENGNPSLDKINELSINEQINNSRLYSEFITQCKVPLANNNYVDCSKIYTIEEYLTFEDECIFFYKEAPEKSQDKLNENFKNDSVISINLKTSEKSSEKNYQIEYRTNRPVEIDINKKIVKKRLTFTLHSENITFDHYDHNFIKLSPHRYSKTVVSFSLINIENLPPPFKTMCTNYRKYNFKTKGNCVRQCLIKAYKQIYQKWPPNIPVRSSILTFANYQTDLNSKDKASNKSIKTQRTLCEEKCNFGTPCHQEMFEPFVVSESETLIKNQNLFKLFIDPPTYIIDFKYEIKTPMIHFLCYIASTTNLWLGISAFPLFHFFLKWKGLSLNKNKDENYNIKPDKTYTINNNLNTINNLNNYGFNSNQN